MSYMLLIVEPARQRYARTESEGRAKYDSMLEFSEKLKARGLLAMSQSLKGDERSARVQVRGEATVVLDGPFAEAKEMVGGFFLVDCATHDEAVALAEACPAAQSCTIEIRKLGPCYN